MLIYQIENFFMKKNKPFGCKILSESSVFYMVVIFKKDRQKLFLDLISIFASVNVSIHQARIFTLANGSVIDTFTISIDPTLLITGDLSFFYDSNGLWNNYIPKNFKIIVINNDGGGIFRILPGNDNSDIFKTFFETKHGRSAKLISIDNGFNYNSANSSSTLKEKLSQFFTKSDKPQVLEIFTPFEINDKILLEYFEYLKNNSAN